MEDAPSRPSEELIKNAYDRLLNVGSLSKLRDAALADRLLPSLDGSGSTVGRSIAWKLFLISDEPLQSSSTLRKTSVINALRNFRQNYLKQLHEHMRAPDGSYEEDFTKLPGSSELPKSPLKDAENLMTNNPLSLHNENPWKEWFASVELRKTISQDVERTFPDIEFFRNPEVQLQLTNILFLYSAMNPLIGYRQGMHEVLAPLYYAVDYDSLAQNGGMDDSQAREMCSRVWVTADAWALFNGVMRGLSKWYEWREPPLDLMPGGGSSPLATHFHLNIPDGRLEIKPYVAPIVEACNRIQTNLLRNTDPLLWKHLQAAGIEPQIYGIRWLRLLFTREFNMVDAMKLWDGLFACDPTFELAHWVCVAMLIRIRNELIPADYSDQLTVLLRYPSPRAQLISNAPHHVLLLLRQALALQMSPTPSTGISLIIENRNLLNIPSDVPVPPPVPQRRHQSDKTAAAQSRATSMHSGGHSRQPTAPQMSLPEMIARGLLERGEHLGINKTFMNAVSEIRRNIPDLAASLVRSPDASYSTFPLTDERPPEERPPWEPRTRFEMEKDISQLRSTNKRLGESLGWIVDVLLQDEAEAKNPSRLKKQRQEALESLSYIRDILIGNVAEIEEERLIGEEEALMRTIKDITDSPHDTLAVTVPPPLPASVVDTRQMAISRGSPSLPQPSRSPTSGSPSVFVRKIPIMNTIVSSSSNSSRLPPWNHTRSAFSGLSPPLPVEALPRLPPPTSTGQQQVSLSGSVRKGSTDQSPHKPIVHQDPLGVLR